MNDTQTKEEEYCVKTFQDKLKTVKIDFQAESKRSKEDLKQARVNLNKKKNAHEK